MAQLPQAIFVTRVEWFPKVRTFAQAIVANRWFIEFMETMPTYLFVLQTLKISIPDSKLRSRRLSTLAGKKGTLLWSEVPFAIYTIAIVSTNSMEHVDMGYGLSISCTSNSFRSLRKVRARFIALSAEFGAVECGFGGWVPLGGGQRFWCCKYWDECIAEDPIGILFISDWTIHYVYAAAARSFRATTRATFQAHHLSVPILSNCNHRMRLASPEPATTFALITKLICWFSVYLIMMRPGARAIRNTAGWLLTYQPT